MRMSRNNYGLMIASAAIAVSLTGGPLAGAALATGGNGNANGNSNGNAHGSAAAQQAHDKNAAKKAAKDQGSKTKGHSASKPKAAKPKSHPQPASSHAAAAPGHTKAKSASTPTTHGHGGGAKSDPPGNNGTVKIAALSDAIGHPSNNPHPGCSLVVEWFGYDQGSDVVSTVTFAPQAPTSDVTIGGTTPSQVFVGGDHAGGGTDLDGRQAYQLTFSGGAPHPKQGYHVKVTVATPRSLGNDTKTKVFWIAPCTDSAAGSPAVAASGATASTEDTSTVPAGAADTAPTATGRDTSAGAGEVAGGSDDKGVLGTVAQRSANTGEATTDDTTAAVPTAVDAGENAGVLDWAQSPVAWLLVTMGVLLAAGAVVLRRSRA